MWLQRRPAGGPTSLVRALDDFETLFSRRAGEPYCPRFDMREMKDRYVLEGELPGVEKKDINIEFTDNNTLSVSGHTEQATSTEGPEHSWWYSERSTGDFRRSFNFPAPVDHDHVEASLNNGVLSISLPKAQAESTGKRIDINSVNYGPLYSGKAKEKVRAQLHDAVSKGAKVSYTGHEADATTGKGPNFYHPTVLTGATPDMLFTQEETFGPLAFLVPFQTHDEVIAMPNKKGAHVVVADIPADNGNRVVNAITSKADTGNSGIAIFVSLDVTKRVKWDEAPAIALVYFGKLDIVVNNAGTTYKKQPSIDVTEEDFDRIVAVNRKSIYLSVSVIMPYFMAQKKGVFLNTSSVAGTRVRPGQVFYGGTKGFMNTITQGLAAEYGPHGVRVNSICPLRGATGLLEMSSGVPDTPEERERFAKTVPLGRMSEPSDVASAAVYLASDEASFVTGVNLPIDGGRLAV
ncbi:hypothetical protein HFD88_005151 [Aspergillus terreus]|nr:hypothetical protein HFD88_005151 [Aspergillus terreus]